MRNWSLFLKPCVHIFGAIILLCTMLPAFAVTVHGSGPDLLGIHIGQTPDEVLAVLKARAPKERWRTVSAQLQFKNSRGLPEAVPAPQGTVRAAIVNDVEWSTALDKYQVHFSPVAGQERVVSVARTQNFGQTRPLATDVIARLVEKYGKPAAQFNSGGAEILLWAFDASGNPRPITAAALTKWQPCSNGVAVEYAPKHPLWSLNYTPEGLDGRTSVSHVAACGDTMVRARVYVSAGYVGDAKGFSQAMHLELIGHAAATAAAAELKRTIAAAASGELGRAHDAAKTRAAKPDM